MIYQSKTTEINDYAITYVFSGSGGPGGQNVNRVATAVQLRLNLASVKMRNDVRARLKALAGSRIIDSGELLINARTFRSQRENREDAVQRLIELIKKAEDIPKKRKRTAPTRASKERRLNSKKHRSDTKSSRRKIDY